MPKISVIVPCYNQAQYLDECLQSVLDQTFQDWECIIVNDGSTDHSEEIAKSWVQKDERFRYFHKDNSGVNETRNFGLSKASGEWIQFLDGDDTLSTDKFSKSMQFKEEYDVIISNFDTINGTERETAFCNLSRYEISFESLLARWDIDLNLPIHCPIVRKNVVDPTRFNTHLTAKEDWIFWLEIFYRRPRIFFIDEILCSYRQHSNGASKNFLSVYENNYEANVFVYSLYDAQAKDTLFMRINEQLLNINKQNFHLKKHLQKLQNTKILKIYLKPRRLLGKVFQNFMNRK